jgi:outer membrane lipoprotein SlyB
MKTVRWITLAVIAIGLSGCATMPPGPSVMVMPGGGKNFESFQADDAACRGWAQTQSGWNANDTVNQNVAAGAVGGGALGAGAGALIGAASGAAGPGAAIGAGAGLLAGTLLAAPIAQGSGYEVQRRYDNAYQQCMYAKGNQIPAAPSARPARHLAPPPPPPPGYTIGTPPPPPPPVGAYYRPQPARW